MFFEIVNTSVVLQLWQANCFEIFHVKIRKSYQHQNQINEAKVKEKEVPWIPSVVYYTFYLSTEEV